MTTRERILTLADGGHEPHMIAALLGLDVTDVAETLALPAHTPSDPSGGGGAPLTRWIWFAAQGGDQAGANQYPTAIGTDAMIPVLDPSAHKANEMSQSPISSVGYAEAGGRAVFNILAELLGWASADVIKFEAGPCVVWSIDGTNWATFNLAPVLLDSSAPDINGNVKHKYTSGDFTLTHQSGEDFSVGEEGEILTAAGGAFQSAYFCYARVE